MNHRSKYPRISKPVEVLKHNYDVVVIGSGYGGGVAASRMARGRQSVCVLELGKERWPGEYPETIEEAGRELHLSGDFSTRDMGPAPVETGDPTGLYHLILGNGQSALVANGLGGTSLLSANVFLEADEKTMAMQDWPPEIRENPGCLKKYYDRARHMLEPQVYPDNFPTLNKLEVLKEQAKVLGYEDKFRKVDQTTWFKEDGLNNSGVRMKQSKLTGMDSMGVNDGSKSSTLVNYLADAWNWGAEIFTRCEVRYIKKHKTKGYLIFFAWHGAKRDKFKNALYKDLMWVHAKKMVFLGAGALGTTEILLRSKEYELQFGGLGLEMSDHVGRNMSGNGDMLVFGYNLNRNINSLARTNPLPPSPVGPTITGIIDCRDTPDVLDGFVIEEGVIPEIMMPFMQFMLPNGEKPEELSFLARLLKIIGSLSSRFGGHYNLRASLERTQTYLIMCHDDNQAVLTLKNGKPNLYFQGVRRQKHVAKLLEKLKAATVAFDGTFVNNPFYLLDSEQEITVHPIGGSFMSSNGEATNGVVNHKGQVLTGYQDKYHPGLVVVDAAAIPTTLGANPFATITALAERSVELVAEEFGIEIDYETKNKELDFWKTPEQPIIRRVESISREEESILSAIRDNKEGIQFSEIMSGYVHISDDATDFELAEQIGSGQCEMASFFLSVHAYDVQKLLNSAEHKAKVTGTFTSAALPASPYMVIGGDFELFTIDCHTPDTKNLIYDFDMCGTDDSVIHFQGFKSINDKAAFSILGTWEATTTLRVTLSNPQKEGGRKGRVIGKGILYIKPWNLVSELKTFYSTLHSGMRFLGYFARNLVHVFFAPLAQLEWPMEHYRAWSPRHQPSHTFAIQSEDGVTSRMLMWDPLSTQKQHVELLFIPGVSVDESIFTVPDIDENVIDYFRRKGYRCFCVVHRIGRNDNARDGWTAYDARLDIAAAVDKIEDLRRSTKYGKLSSRTYIVAHCAGSIALASGLLGGDIATSSIAGITASQVFMTPQYASYDRWKAAIPFSTRAYSMLARTDWYDCNSNHTDSFFQQGLNQLLRFYPLGQRELCSSVVCHRSSFIFGLMCAHENLNARTHNHLHDYLGGVTMRCQRHLIEMGKAGEVIGSNGEKNLVNDDNLGRLRDIPILLLSGDKNCVYNPENTLESYDILRTKFGEENYKRELLTGFGHLDTWVSPKSVEKVFPLVNNHLNGIVARMKKRGLNDFLDDPSINADGKALSQPNQVTSLAQSETSPHGCETALLATTFSARSDELTCASWPSSGENASDSTGSVSTYAGSDMGTVRQDTSLTPQVVHSSIRLDTDNLEKLSAMLYELCSIPNESNQQTANLKHSIRFELFYDIAFLQQGNESTNDQHYETLQNLLTLNSDGENVQALTCMQYLQCTWPKREYDLLPLIIQIARKGQGQLNAIECTVDGSKTESFICFDVTGSVSSISEVSQGLVWLGTVLRDPPASRLICYCLPIITVQATSICTIEYVLEVMPASGTSDQCWQSMFQSAIVAKGFPVAKRAAAVHGLEMNLGTIMALSGAYHIGKIDDCFVIRGFSSLFTISKRRSGHCCWHFLGKIDGPYLSKIKEKLRLHACKFPSLGPHEILHDRHFVGWCRQATYGAGKQAFSDYVSTIYVLTIRSGAADSNFGIKRSGLDRAPNSFPTFDKRIYRGQRYAQESVYVAMSKGISKVTGRSNLIEQLSWLRNQSIILWDVPEQRGWLINGTSALLHLVYASLKRDEQEEDDMEYFCFEWPSLQRPAVHRENSSKVILSNTSNLSLRIYSHGDCFVYFQERVEDLFFLLEAIIDQQCDLPQSMDQVMTVLHGWEFMELANSSRNPLYPRALSVDKDCSGWMNLVLDTSTVTLFGRGFGEIFQPESYSKTCPYWAKLPTGKCYLAANVRDLRRIMEDHGSEPIKLSDHTVWAALPSTFETCDCTTSGKHRSLVQLLISNTDCEGLTSISPPHYSPPSEGAVVFGANNDTYRMGDRSSSCIPDNVALTSVESPQRCDSYSVAIICALPKELKAVRLLFDKSHVPPSKLDANDPNVYEFGRINDHNIIATCLPKGGYGNCSATDVCSHLRRSFPNVESFLLVGIGGGIPSRDNDIRLGDVVVSVPGNGSPGVVKYDFQRVKQNEDPQILSCLHPPPQRLLAVISHLDSEVSSKFSDIQSYISHIVASEPSYCWPGRELDRLYQAEYTHVKGDNRACTRCVGPLVTRPVRSVKHPFVHYGLIASGDQVIRDAKRRDCIGSQYGTLCFDMEAAGVASKIPCLVIRGICDYADSHKSKLWQNYAAASAAAYTKLLLCSMRRSNND